MCLKASRACCLQASRSRLHCPSLQYTSYSIAVSATELYKSTACTASFDLDHHQALHYARHMLQPTGRTAAAAIGFTWLCVGGARAYIDFAASGCSARRYGLGSDADNSAA